MIMKFRHAADSTKRDAIFSSPIRKLSADEIELVGGADGTEPNLFGKAKGGVDNHSKEM
jgi:hypothetical protein